MKKNAKNKRSDAERATEHYAHEIMDCIRTVRSVRTQWQKQDMFSCDVLGKRADGTLVALQVTAGQSQAVTERRRKIEGEIWHLLDKVQILQLVQTDNPGKGARKLWFFRVHVYSVLGRGRYWKTLPDAVPVPKEWFRKWKDMGIK